MGRLAFTLFQAGAILIASIDAAQAYIDPGTGSIILQSIIGGIAAGGVVLKLYWAKVKALLSSNSADKRARGARDSQDPQ